MLRALAQRKKFLDQRVAGWNFSGARRWFRSPDAASVAAVGTVCTWLLVNENGLRVRIHICIPEMGGSPSSDTVGQAG